MQHIETNSGGIEPTRQLNLAILETKTDLVNIAMHRVQVFLDNTSIDASKRQWLTEAWQYLFNAQTAMDNAFSELYHPGVGLEQSGKVEQL